MAGKYLSYAEYKDSGVEWLGEIPDHWNISKLKFLADIQPSNIDKKTKDGEIPVMLCNYTDVYYNDEADESINYMRASATDEQIEKFTLKAGDTIITKDSEDPSDIAVPAFVPNDLPGVVCGYHLAMIRPKNCNYGAYVKRVFESDYAQAYFETRANGLTRYGLGTYPLCNAYYPNPTESEAITIANFLDHETAKIDTLIAKQQQLIKLLKEKRQVVISHAVTKGLNPDAPMKDSGVEWLGEVPERWSTIPLKLVVTTRKGVAFKSSDFCDSGVRVVKASDIKNLGVKTSEVFLPISFAEQYPKALLRENDIILSTVGSTPDVKNSAVGQMGILPKKLEGALLNQNTVVFDPMAAMHKGYLPFVLHTAGYRDHLDLHAHGTANQASLNVSDMTRFIIPLPPYEEQIAIYKYIVDRLKNFDQLELKATRAQHLLIERRTALISAAVTGKIDVRNWKP